MEEVAIEEYKENEEYKEYEENLKRITTLLRQDPGNQQLLDLQHTLCSALNLLKENNILKQQAFNGLDHGNLIQAKYRNDGQFYDAVVLFNDRGQENITVGFIDYQGEVAKIKIDDILPWMVEETSFLQTIHPNLQLGNMCLARRNDLDEDDTAILYKHNPISNMCQIIWLYPRQPNELLKTIEVPLDSLKPYKALKAKFCVGSKVRAEYSEDHLWYPAVVDGILHQEQKYLITFTQYGTTEEIGHHQITCLLPIKGSNLSLSPSTAPSLSKGQNSLTWIVEDAFPQKTLKNEQSAHLSDQYNLGEWEKHTRGFGSRMMQKMGYTQGCGLGKEGKGIIQPIEVEVYPPGKSIDFINNNKKKKKKLGSSSSTTTTTNEENEDTMFSYINERLQLGSKKTILSTQNDQSVNGKKSKHKPTLHTIGKSLIEMKEKADIARKQIAELEISIQRNIGYDNKMVQLHRETLEETKEQLRMLQEYEQTLADAAMEHTKKSKNKHKYIF